MKNLAYTLLILSIVSLVACKGGNDSDSPSQQSVSLQLVDKSVKLAVGQTTQLRYVVSPTDAVLTWQSDNPDVALVVDGTVVAKSMGNAKITVSCGEVSDECTVVVTNAAGHVLVLNEFAVLLEKGQTHQVDYQCFSTAIWQSDNTAAVTVDQNGLLTAVAPGVAVITVKADDESYNLTAAVKHNWSGYELTWSDEFEGASVNASNWNIQQGVGPNQEKQYYTNREDNIRVKDGMLEIELKKENYGSDNTARNFTSARINTYGKHSFKYGKVEARISFPAGGGTWPAFWMLGDNRTWPSCGEIDIVEHMGNQPYFASFALHTSAANGNNGRNWHRGKTFDSPIENEFHVYGIEWLEEEQTGRDQINFYIDNEVYATAYEDNATINNITYWPFNQNFYIILNLAFGGTMGGAIDETIFDNPAQPVVMKVDYVRVYQRHEL